MSPVGEIGELVMVGSKCHGGLPRHVGRDAAGTAGKVNGKRWLYTGDIARMDEDGYFYIVDRKKDMVLIGGYNVYPTAVENAIAIASRTCLEVGALPGFPHPERVGQEAIKAWIVS